MTKEEIIVTIVGAVLSSGIFNMIFSHILYNNKLKKELKIKGSDMIAKEICESLQSVRNMELKLTVQEIFDMEGELEQRGSQVNMFDGECIYPEIFNDWDSYNDFHEMVQECRNKHEKNLSCKMALNVVFIDRYIYQLGLFMAENGGEEMLPMWGTIFIFDLQKWQKKIDKMLVKEINRYSYKLESHKTWKWNFWRKKELEKQWESTILYYLLYKKCRRRDKKKMEIFEMMLNEIFSENEDEALQE